MFWSIFVQASYESQDTKVQGGLDRIAHGHLAKAPGKELLATSPQGAAFVSTPVRGVPAGAGVRAIPRVGDP